MKKGRDALTMKDLAERYMTEHSRPKKKPAGISRDQKLLDRFILPALGTLKVNEVSSGDVSRLHSRIGRKTPIQANRVLALPSKMMTLAIRWGFRTDDNPCSHVKRFRENKRERFLSAEELARLGHALAKAEQSGKGSYFSIQAIRSISWPSRCT